MVLGWAWTTIESYVLAPSEGFVRWVLVLCFEDTLDEIPSDAVPTEPGGIRWKGMTYNGVRYVPDPTGRKMLPEYVVKLVDDEASYFGPTAAPPASAKSYWHRYFQVKWMHRKYVVPIFLIVFLTVLYFFGRLFTFGIGRWFVRTFDSAILRIPIINKVYGGVKQVTDFAFDEREIEFNNVVAVEYPRRGIWSLGFVTGNSVRQISEATGEPMLSVLMPTSPMPMTGFTVTVKKSETIDVDMTVDEAIQFVVSCGVVVPPNQRIGNGETPKINLPSR